MEGFIMAIVGLSFLYGIEYIRNQKYFDIIPLTSFSDKTLLELITNMLNFHKETQGVKSIPKIKVADLSKEKSEYDDSRVEGLYVYNLKMIIIDVNHLKSRNRKLKDLARIVSHEWQHYVDHLNGITYDTVGVDMCENRATKFAVRGSRQIIKNLEFN